MSSQQIKALLIQMAEYYDKQLSEPQLKMYTSDLGRYPAEALSRAFEVYRNDPKNFRFPLPGQLIAILNPKTDDRDDAIDIARRLQEAAATHHSYWDFPKYNGGPAYYESNKGKFHTFHEAAVSQVGELGAEVIRRFGGWKRFYESYLETDRGQFHAQLREMVESTIKRARAGSLQTLPKLSDYAPRAQIDFMARALERDEEGPV